MEETQHQNSLKSSLKQFRYYKMLGDKTFTQLSDEELFRMPGVNSNSIGIIVKHLWGNMMSRWTDFLNSDGEKEWRNREAEFEADIKDREELLAKWEAGWDCVFTALGGLKEEDLSRIIYIRNQGHTLTEAIHRQMAHYAYHVGQIVFIGRMYKGKSWISLSIAKGASKAFNEKKFEQEKKRGHFTDEFLKE